MSGPSVSKLNSGAGVLAAAMLLASCAVGPDFLHPGAPDTERYTKEPLTSHTSSTDAPTGKPQRFVQGRDIPQEWWALFRSRALNAVIERALNNNPSLQSAIATLRAANQAVYAQQGHYFPFVQANFNPTRQLTAGSISPVLNSTANPFNLYTTQVAVSYTFDIWGLNRRTVESLQALADTQHFQVEAAYLTLTSTVAIAAITEASLRGQIDATNQLIAINSKMLGILRKQLGVGYTDRLAVAAQEAALAQVLATLPPLRKALEQNRNLLSALAGIYPSQGPRETFKLADLNLPTHLPLSLPSQLIEQRPDIRAAEEQLHSASAQIGVATANLLPAFTIGANAGYINTAMAGLLGPQNLFWQLAGNATQTVLDGGTLLHLRQEAKDTYEAAAWGYRGTVIGAVQNVTDSLRAIQNDADALKAARDFERAAKISLDLATQQLHFGLADELFLLNAQQTYAQALLQVVQARAARLADTVALFAALGGGWWNRATPPPEQTLNVGTGETRPVVDRREGFFEIFFPPQPD
jgi:NodT family efflux transporter outer membrane factor (OMF) lipoprotein